MTAPEGPLERTESNPTSSLTVTGTVYIDPETGLSAVPDHAPSDSAGWHCADCGSPRLRWRMAACAWCGQSLDGEPEPASRRGGMYHRRCYADLHSYPERAT